MQTEQLVGQRIKEGVDSPLMQNKALLVQRACACGWLKPKAQLTSSATGWRT